MIRDMMLYHSAKFASPTVRVQQSRALLDFRADSVRDQGGSYEAMLRRELDGLRRSGDYYLAHEHLEEVNQPIYFHQFVSRAAAHGLRYLGEARVGTMLQGGLEAGVRQAMRFLAADQIQAEQYMDFLRNRTFRQTLLCHQDAPVNWTIRPESLFQLHAASSAVPAEESTPLGPEQGTFRLPSGVQLGTSDPLLKAAMLCLRDAWPQSVAFHELADRARRRVGSTGEEEADRRSLASGLLNGYLQADLIELSACPFPFTVTVSERPVASPLARHQVASQPYVTTRRHETLPLDQMDRRVLSLLDGSHTKEQILGELVSAAAAGHISVVRQGDELRDPDEVRKALGPGLDDCLVRFARSALLIA